MTYVPSWKERLEDAKAYTGPAISGLIVLALAGWVVWHEVIPREKEKRLATPPSSDQVALAESRRQLTREVNEFENTYRRALEAGENDTTVGMLLDRAIARQRDRARLEPNGDNAETARLAKFEGERASLRARVASARSIVLEREAESAAGSGEAMEKLREALRLQREANAATGPAETKDFQREARLAQTLELAENEPLRAKLATALTLARGALVRDERDKALKAFADARELQAELTRRYPQTSAGSATLLAEIDGEIESLKAQALAENSAAREREGDLAAAKGRAQDAATAYALAEAQQREINEKFPRSKPASAARVDQLEAKRQTALSSAAVARLAALDEEITTLLRQRRNAAAVEKIGVAERLAEKTATEFSRSTALDPDRQSRLAYLAAHASEIEALQEQVFSQLVLVPEAKGARMLRTEVPQELYARVTGGNPSRTSGGALPVDSVSWHDAQDFCRRLGWLLGVRVRLPTETEFRAAFGTDGGAWSADTSDGHTHEVGKSLRNGRGFFDLAGNVAEWLQPPTDSGDQAAIAGGSYLDANDALLHVPIAVIEKRERSRHVGFRVVVESAP